MRLVIDLDQESPRIVGRLRADGGQERGFIGWLGLISVLDAAFSPALSAPATAGAVEAPRRRHETGNEMGGGDDDVE